MIRRGCGCSSPRIAPISRRRIYGTRIARQADPRDVIQDYLVQRVEPAEAQNRSGVVGALQGGWL